MSANDQADRNPDNDLLDEELEGEGEDEENGKPASLGWTGWLISGAFHIICLIIVSLVVIISTQDEVDTSPVRVATIDPPPKVEEKPKDERTLEQKVELNVANEVDVPAPITQLDLPVDISQSEEETESPIRKGREEAVADSEMGSSGAFMAIGAGGGAAGMFGSRTGGGKKRAIGKHGGSRGSEGAVNAGLRWLKRHQSPNGMWHAVDYPANCQETPKCEPGRLEKGDTNVAMTGYAVLCFLGAGYDHKSPNPYKSVVKKGLDYLISVQKPDGLLGERNYENAVASMALCEAYAMTSDPDLKGPAQKSVDVILKNQCQDAKAKDSAYAGLGWDYTVPKATRIDSSVSGWNVMALKSALAGQLNVGSGMEGAKNWLEKTWKATNPDWAKLDPYGKSRFPYTYNSETEKIDIGAVGSDHKDLACVGMVACVFLGHHAGDIMLETLANYVMEHQMPAAQWPPNTYYMYYNTLGVFQMGGDKWQKWNTTVRDQLVNAQRKGDGCFDGSWNWEGQKWHGYGVGRVLTTTYCILSLEVYYRYAQAAGKK